MTLTEADWEGELGSALGYVVRVEYTRARSSPIQLRHARPAELRERPELAQGWVVRLHRVFAEAPPTIRADLASWIRVGRRARRACRELGAWTQQAITSLPTQPAPRARLEAKGLAHDLDELAKGLLSVEFRDDFDLFRQPPPMTWGRRVKSRTRGRLNLGSFSPRTGIVRIHPVLDQEAVPSWLVRYVLFHELLHAALPSERDASGRIRHHGPIFRRREREYSDYGRALEWERKYLPRLLRSAKSGKPMRGAWWSPTPR